MTSPDHLSPDGAQSATSLGPFYQNADPEALGIGANSETNALLQLMQNNFFTKILGGFTSAVGAVADGITSVVEAITGILGGTLADLDQWSTDVKDGQVALNDRVDLLSPLEDYGAVYAPGQGEIMNTGKVPFNRPIGPAKGCHLASNGIVLDEKGLWKVDARLAFGWTVAPGGGTAVWEIRVVDDSTGEVFLSRVDRFDSMSEQTRQLSFPIVIPESGYRVEAHITTLIVGRGMRGGPSWNGLSVHHLSHSTVNIVGN